MIPIRTGAIVSLLPSSHLQAITELSSVSVGQYIAGVGNDPRSSRQFNPIKQGKDYDGQGESLCTHAPAPDC